MSLIFGPIPSRRLGRSLGINDVARKTCSYGCVYCQLGPTERTHVERRSFRSPEQIAKVVAERIEELRRNGDDVDVLTFVPEGEPTLDRRLGATIEALRPLGVPVAVVTNGSLLTDPEVRADVARAQWVSVKIDSVHEQAWRAVDRPDPRLSLPDVLEGVRRFAAQYDGTLVTETMLVAGINDAPDALRDTATFIATLRPATAYLGVPTRPPAEEGVRAPDDAALVRAWEIFVAAGVPSVEVLASDPTPQLAKSGDAASELRAIAAVHPLREVEVDALLRASGAERSVLEPLLESGALRVIEHRGQRFYVAHRSAPIPR